MQRGCQLSAESIAADLQTSPPGNTMNRSGFGGCHENSSIMIRIFSSGVGLSCLVPVPGSLDASTYQGILDNFMLQTLWNQFRDGSFLFQHHCAPVEQGP